MKSSLLRVEKNLGSAPLEKSVIDGAAVLSLPFSERSKSRLRVWTGNGQELAIFMERGAVLRDGDILQAVDGSYIRVEAAPEAVLQATAPSPLDMTKAAFHLGNRHTPVQIGSGFIRLEYDSVLEDMLKKLGLTVERTELPFQPEAGAYAGGHHHGHEETFIEDYALAQDLYQHHLHKKS